ncbi:hypothetical protein SADUNF_Sadunf14G0036900 [Salix dunnii]|uniref:Uncharacterized protein n=1 Tax=Salix dunnii TaxID=1413687 RepID=A0A835JI31_9ROSI|nr:hypothetical protein SADUNF_Sadunf14G0036900 [Salix dunnii]
MALLELALSSTSTYPKRNPGVIATTDPIEACMGVNIRLNNDHNRALGQISEKLDVQYPDINHTTVKTSSGEKPVRELVSDDECRRCFLLSGNMASMGVCSDGSYGIQPGLVYTLFHVPARRAYGPSCRDSILTSSRGRRWKQQQESLWRRNHLKFGDSRPWSSSNDCKRVHVTPRLARNSALARSICRVLERGCNSYFNGLAGYRFDRYWHGTVEFPTSFVYGSTGIIAKTDAIEACKDLKKLSIWTVINRQALNHLMPFTLLELGRICSFNPGQKNTACLTRLDRNRALSRISDSIYSDASYATDSTEKLVRELVADDH